MVYFITYSNEEYRKARDLCVRMAIKKGKVDKAIAYTPDDIDACFCLRYKHILENKRGNGLWLWKPYFVCKTLDNVDENDVVVYCDAGSFFFKSHKKLLASMDDDIWVSNIPLIEKQFTKPELMERLCCTSSFYSETNIIQANFIAIRNTDRGRRFAYEWLDACTDGDNLFTDTRYDSSEVSFAYFEHRSDQSVLSLLAKKWGLTAHRDPSQFGRIPEKYYAKGRMYKRPINRDTYRPFIILHRKKEPGCRECFTQWVLTWIPKPLMIASAPYREVKKWMKNCGVRS